MPEEMTTARLEAVTMRRHPQSSKKYAPALPVNQVDHIVML
jgi:hypothetical protein